MKAKQPNQHVETMRRLRLFQTTIDALPKAEREHWALRYQELRGELKVGEALDAIEAEIDDARS